MTLSYEEQRLANIRENEALLLSLGLASPAKPKPVPKAKPAPKPKTTAAAKRKVAEAEYKAQDESETDTESESGGDDEQPRKRQRKAKGKKKDKVPEGVRRSGRATRQPKRFDPGLASESESDSEYAYRPPRRVGGAEPQRRAQRLGQRIHDPKRFGSIPGVEVGTWWATRMDCSTAAVHAPTVAGISGDAERGAWSVALSGGYPDDVDMGEMFTYTGSGGRDLKGTRTAPKNLRTAPQTFDQSFEHRFNAALKRSAETRKPVRVILGFKLDSPYAPAEGYRYDGLYVVERAWMAPGLTKKLLVCRYAFRRLPGQPPLPVRGEEDEEDQGEEGEEQGAQDEQDEEEDEEEAEDEAAVEREVAEEVPARRTRSRGSTASAMKNGRSTTATPSSTFIGVELNARPKANGRTPKSTIEPDAPAVSADARPTRATRARASLPTSSGNASPEPKTSGRPARAARARASLPAKLAEPEPTLRRSRRSLAVA